MIGVWARMALNAILNILIPGLIGGMLLWTNVFNRGAI
jgi:hypothetical protein